MRLALTQLDPVVGDVDGNADALEAAYQAAVEQGAHVVVAGELALTGYPPEDLVHKTAFLDATEAALRRLASRTTAAAFVVGFVERLESTAGASPSARSLANAAAVLRDGRVEAVYRKRRIPNYGVFDEARYFVAGEGVVSFEAAGATVGVSVCEDLWGTDGPIPEVAAQGADVVLSINASPYYRGKRTDREWWARLHAQRSGIWLAYLNQIGGQDEIVFDGDSFVISPDGQVVARAAQFATDLLVVDLPLGEQAAVPLPPAEPKPRLEPVAEVYAALVLATGDYLRKNGFERALVGLSGGIDSSLVATVAADALGPAAVTGVAMPSPYSSPGSVTDAKTLAHNLDVEYLELPIADAMSAFERTLAGPFAGTGFGVAEENLQARIRGSLLMALSNKFGWMVLTTGNKSEYAVGYATLYGDMAGGFAPLRDVPKTLVYELCRYRNDVAGSELIPGSTLDKPPSAELRPDQRDTDSLPPYEVLDVILEAYVEQDLSVRQIVRHGFDEAIVRRVATLVDRAEYKRRQAAPGVKITRRAFGKDRRLPITHGWHS